MLLGSRGYTDQICTLYLIDEYISFQLKRRRTLDNDGNNSLVPLVEQPVRLP
jgi:hypothetical protein